MRWCFSCSPSHEQYGYCRELYIRKETTAADTSERCAECPPTPAHSLEWALSFLKSWWRAQHSSQQRPCWVLSLKPGAHTWQSSKGSWQPGAAIQTQIWETARKTMKRWLSYIARDQFWKELQWTSKVVKKSAFKETRGGELLPFLCVWTLLKAIPGRITISSAPHFTTQSFHPLCFLHIWDGQLSYSLFSFLTMTFIDRGHSECSGHILCSSRLSLKIRAQFNFMRFNEIHFSRCCPWPDTGRNIKLGFPRLHRYRTLFIGHSSSH